MSAEPESADSQNAQSGYLFIDNVRFVSMIAILMRHCELSLYGSSPVPPLESMLIQFRTFGVQLFFVNSAFLMADWLSRPGNNVRGYWNNRVHAVGIPWLIWVAIYVGIDALRLLTGHRNPAVGFGEGVVRDIFYQSYWYVPILFFSLVILLPLRRYWYSWRLGFFLLLVSLVYGVNQYAGWFPPSHTIAFFGYLFPLWLGLQLYQRFQAVLAWVNKVPWWLVSLLLALAFGCTLLEDHIALGLGFPNTYNALQTSNQLYCFVVLLVLIKLPVSLVPAFINVRRETYGIYLAHQVVAEVGRGTINLAAGRTPSGESLFMRLPMLVPGTAARIGLWFLWSAVVYTVSLLITKMLRKASLAWTVGRP